MTEHDLVDECQVDLKARLPFCFLWKIADRMTGGIPDLEINWNNHTTKIEFKLMKRGENIHQKWEDERQLITCVRYEQQTSRCWVVAYQQASTRFKRVQDYTIIYRPTKLLNAQVPEADETFDSIGPGNLPLLWSAGVIRLSGFNHRAVSTLIKFTHQ